MKAEHALVKLEGGDHSFKAKKSNMYSNSDLKTQQNEAVEAWIASREGLSAPNRGLKRTREDEKVEEAPTSSNPGSPSKKAKQQTLTAFFTGSRIKAVIR